MRRSIILASILVGVACDEPEEPIVHSRIWHSYAVAGECLDARLNGPDVFSPGCVEWHARMHKVSYRAPDGRCWIGPPTKCELPDGWSLAADDQPCGQDEWLMARLCCDALPPM